MVTLNLTLFVQLILFLTFLWVLNRLVLSPLLRTMDEREEGIVQAEAAAESDENEAERVEADYARSIAEARRTATLRALEARRAALAERNELLGARRTEADSAIERVREEALAQVQAEERHCEALAPEIADAMGGHLGLRARDL